MDKKHDHTGKNKRPGQFFTAVIDLKADGIGKDEAHHDPFYMILHGNYAIGCIPVTIYNDSIDCCRSSRFLAIFLNKRGISAIRPSDDWAAVR